MSPEVLIALLTGLGGLGTLVFAALRYRREDASAVVDQTEKLIGTMRMLLDELQETLDRCREERERLRKELERVRR